MPGGVADEVYIVKVALQSGEHVIGLNEAVVPEGSPDLEKLTDSVAPETKVVVTGMLTDSPLVTVPETLLIEIEKSNDE